MKRTSQKRVNNKFKWLPMDERLDNLGLTLPPRKPEIKKPLLWIAIEPQDDFVDDIYLVNETGNTIESVIANTGGFQTLDDDMFSISGPDIKKLLIMTRLKLKNTINCVILIMYLKYLLR